MRIQIVVILVITLSLMIPNLANAESVSEVYKLTDGTNTYDIQYTITNGSLKNMIVDEEAGTLLVEINSTNNGTIVIEIPRKFIDWRYINCQDIPFIVLVEGEEVYYEKVSWAKAYYNETKTTHSRTLTIPFEQEDKEIEILGNPGVMKPDVKTGDECPPLENEWKIQNVVRDGQVFKVPYKITTGTVEKIEYDVGALLVQISNENNGIIEITIPRNLFDQKIIESLSPDEVQAGKTIKDFKDDNFFILIDGEEPQYEETSKSSCFRSVMIKFPLGARDIEFPTTWAGLQPPIDSTPVLPVYVTTNKGNYEHGETIAISGCTDLAFDYDKVNLEILNPEGKTYDVVTVPTKPDGTFAYSFQASGELGIDGNYTVNASYGDNMTSHTFTIPEFPIVLLLLTLSFIPIIFLSKPRILTSIRKSG